MMRKQIAATVVSSMIEGAKVTIGIGAAPVPENRNGIGFRARRVGRFDRATKLIGAEAMSLALGITARAVRHKLSVDRGLTATDMQLGAAALEKRAAELTALAAELRGLAEIG